jgi:hypothetical protein
VQLGHAGVDGHARIGMVDDVHADRHPLTLGEQVGNENRLRREYGERPIVSAACPSLQHPC